MQEDFSKYNGEGTVLRKAQMRMVEILVEVDKICRKHNITYWLDGGTCLGAVRHGGFIPWDDDLDIALLRKDYLRLCKILKKELPDNLIFQDETTDKNYPLKFAKVRDKNSCFEDMEMSRKIKENGIYIDIFPIERGTRKLKNTIDFFYGRAFRRLRHQLGGKSEYIISLFMYPFACVWVWLARTFNFMIPKDLLIYGYGVPNFNKYQLHKKDFIPVKPIIFENHSFPAPANTDAYLKELYGNYMQIPPEEKRRIHAAKIEIW
jgi:lipopolysaccharide cholinephosphotransferase